MNTPPKTDRLPSHSIEAEAGVLGCVLQAPEECLGKCVEQLQGPEAFYDLRHRAIYEAMLAMRERGVAIDTITLGQRLKDDHQLEAIGGLTYLSSLPDAVPSAANLEYYAEIVLEKYRLRRLVDFATKAVSTIYESEAEPEQIIADVERGFQELRNQEQNSQPVQVRPWLEIELAPDDESVLIGPGRWLTRGSGAFIVAQTGAGKSTLSATMSFSFALGRPCLGFVPVRPLKSLVIQAEDDDGDLIDMRRGILELLDPTSKESELLRRNVVIVTEKAKTGLPFLLCVVKPLLEKEKPDLVWINPLSAYFGAELRDQTAVATFFRNTLNPMLGKANAGAFIIHHCTKPNKDRNEWKGGELAYFASGSSDLANWSRETIVLQEIREGVFEMSCTKRWRKLGWKDANGCPAQSRRIAYGRDGAMVWRDLTGQEAEELGVRQYSDSALLALVPPAGIDKRVLVEETASAFTLTPRTAVKYVNGALRQTRRMIDGKPVRCALLKAENRPRRDVYPESPAGREVIWLTRLEPES